MLRVMIVEDSATARDLLRHILETDPQLEIAAVAADGVEAVELAQLHRPDLILMDIHMPRMNGLDATRRIMEARPTPIIIISSSALSRDVDWTFQAIEAGALTFQNKPHGPAHPDFENEAKRLIQSIKTMAEVKVIRRIPRRAGAIAAPLPPPAKARDEKREIRLVAVGASTGGPPALQQLLLNMPSDLPVPVVIVQHIAPGFLTGMIDWLAKTTGQRIASAVHGAMALPGRVYFAPENRHLEVDGARRLILSDGEPEYGVRPAVAHLFRAVATALGGRAAGVLLTGMGCDGAVELRLMRDRGALTYAQDKESSVVHGMPGEAIRLEAAMHVLPPDKIGRHLAAMLERAEKTLR